MGYVWCRSDVKACPVAVGRTALNFTDGDGFIERDNVSRF
jgi:hypothetical protein